jgi:hypothetical protein
VVLPPMAEQDVLATAAGDLPYGRRQDPAAFLEFGQRPVAAVPRIDVEHDDIAADSGDTDIGIRIVTPPAADRRRVRRCVEVAATLRNGRDLALLAATPPKRSMRPAAE